MKSKLTTIMGTVAFVALAVAAVGTVAHVCRHKDLRQTAVFAQSAEPLGIVCIGSSHAYCTWNPMVCYRESGIPSCAFGSISQPVFVSLAYLDHALKKHKPEVVLFETYSLTRPEINRHTEGSLHDAIDPLPLGLCKARLIESINPETDYENYYFNLLKYHTRWKKLNKRDWTVPSLHWHGFLPYNVYYEQRFPMYDYSQFPEEELSPDRVAFLDEMAERCRKGGAKLVLFASPWDTERDIARLKGLRSYCAERGISFLDMNCREDMDAAGVDGGLTLLQRKDFRDFGHLNTSGATKVTAFLSKWVRSLHEFKRDYNNKYAQRWHADVARCSLFEKVSQLLDDWRIDCFYSESKGKLRATSDKDEGLIIGYPRHLMQEGKRGCQVSGAVSHAQFKLDCDSDGTVVLRLMTQYATDKNGKALPIKQDFASVRVNGKEQLPRGKTVVMNNEPTLLRIKVAKGDTLEVKVSVSRHSYTREELHATLARHSEFSEDRDTLNLVMRDPTFLHTYLKRAK